MHESGIRQTSDKTAALSLKKVGKVQPVQIRVTAEDIEQENRQLLVALDCARNANTQLKKDLEGEREAITFTRKERGFHMSNAERLPSGNDDRGTHLTKNLNIQICITENELRKAQREMDALAASEVCFQFVEISTLNKIYREELSRLEALLHPQNEKEKLVPQADFQRILTQIERVKGELKGLKTLLKKLENERDSCEESVFSGRKTIDKLSYHRELSVKENDVLRAQYNAKLSELSAWQKRVNEYLSSTEGQR